eukprot:jgi/Hompol1/309/HPOL_002764-RA
MVAEVKIEQAKRVRKVSTGHIVFVGLRLATPAIQYGIFAFVAAVRHAVRALVFDAAEPDAAEPARNTLVEAAAEFAADSVNALLSLRVVDGTLGAVQLVATAAATGIATGNSAGIWLFLFVLPDLAFRRVPALETYLAKKYPLQWDDFVKRTPKKLIPYVY